MQNSEMLCLKWNDFQENLNSAFEALRNYEDFSDVTLVCEDGTQVETHKVILASSSPFFMEILKKNKHPHPLIFMRGLKTDILISLVDFLYFGEANVDQEHLEDFLALAEELRLKGMTAAAERNETKYHPEEAPQKNNTSIKRHIEPVSGMQTSRVENLPKKDESFSSEMPVALVSDDVQELNEKVKSLMDFSENRIANGKARARICKVCGKEGEMANIKTHIESNHITSNISHSCDICGKISRSMNGLRQHKAKEHN